MQVRIDSWRVEQHRPWDLAHSQRHRQNRWDVAGEIEKSEGGVGPFTGCTVFNRRGETSPTDHGQTGFN
jgi:hypothetical protein